ncbi:MAG TPA: gamma-glutamyltransferase [Pirellulales bacterium]|nr:gamma-glutamyltransferase [Pirellulales bacterium]
MTARALGWLCVIANMALPTVAAAFDRPSGKPWQGRSAIVAEHGIVATSQPLAAQAGLDVLKAGGNAADAAIAAGAVMGVVEPMSCGIGGDLFVIYWDAKTQKLYGLNGSGRSPYELTREVFAQEGITKTIPDDGPLSWSVPGCVAGWSDLNARFGSRPLGDLLQAAIGYAEHGFPVSEIIAADWKASEKDLAPWPDSVKTFLTDGKAPVAGEIFRNPRLAASYRAIAAGGGDAFYRGAIADAIVAFSRANGGHFSRPDFEDHRSDWVDPVSTTYRGYEVWELPPNGQGIAALEMLNLLEGFDLAAIGPGHPDYLHLFLEAKKLAYADRARFYADPAFAKLPVAELISKPYAARQRGRIDMARAATDVPAGDPLLARGDTIYLTVVDRDRNCCSYIQSNFSGFGSQVVPGDVGFALQNRGALFTFEDNHPNRYQPHKRPFHTIIPALATKDGKPWFVFGVMGGDMQPQGHVQVLVNVIDFKMNVQAAGDAARVRHAGSATPTGLPADPKGGRVFVESGISDAAVDALRAKGHHVARARGGYGGYQGILIDWEHGTLHGGSESRKDGCAAGY